MMGKRSSFPRVPQDRYNTPLSGVEPLLRRLAPGTKFFEPCDGEGDLRAHLEGAGHVCVGSSDIERDARATNYALDPGVLLITNPPWARPVLHAIILNLSDQAPTWLLVDTGWVFTQQAIPSPTPSTHRRRQTDQVDSRHPGPGQGRLRLAVV